LNSAALLATIAAGGGLGAFGGSNPGITGSDAALLATGAGSGPLLSGGGGYVYNNPAYTGP
jgi:alkylation response protein AidB-like acyl-CoA dehydrogenase